MNRNYCKRNNGFSLTEILIVVGILAVLLAILLPAFFQAREKSRMTVCVSNLHQLYQAFSMYAQDNDSRLPIYQNYLYGSVGCSSPACGGPWKKPIPEKGKELVGVLLPYTKSQDVWFCPSDSFAKTDARDGGILHKYSSYRVNIKLGQQLLFNEPFSLQGWDSVFGSSLHDTAKISLMTEFMFGEYCGKPGEVTPPYSHNHRFNTVYLDGHVKSLDECGKSAK